jgi:hypothetical protein
MSFALSVKRSYLNDISVAGSTLQKNLPYSDALGCDITIYKNYLVSVIFLYFVKICHNARKEKNITIAIIKNTFYIKSIM